MTNFELGTHIPWFVRAPWKSKSVGAHVKSFAEVGTARPPAAHSFCLPAPAPD